MAYLTTGKRSLLMVQYQAKVNGWCKALGVLPPTIKLHGASRGGHYLPLDRAITVPPHIDDAGLVHEVAHHLVHMDPGLRAIKGSHGRGFRVALVAVATAAFGHPSRYPWRAEYTNVKVWAQQAGLCEVTEMDRQVAKARKAKARDKALAARRGAKTALPAAPRLQTVGMGLGPAPEGGR